MRHLAYLTACYILGSRYHTGQSSKGYRILCLAQERCKREHSALDIGRVIDGLYSRTDCGYTYPKGCKFRKAVAFFLRRMRHSRKSL